MFRSILQWALPVITYLWIVAYVYKINRDFDKFRNPVSGFKALGVVCLGHVVLGLIIVVAIVVMEGLGMFFSWLY